VEAVKTVSDLSLPVAGTVTEKNVELDTQPEAGKPGSIWKGLDD
jgi:glycine cleavage system H lipoate-binding protein